MGKHSNVILLNNKNIIIDALRHITATDTIYRDISASTMDAFSSVIGNNLNILMKRLSIITIVLSLPTLIASIWGMNFVDLPLEETPYGFYIVLGIALIFTIVGAIFVLFVSKNKKPKK